MLSCAATRLDFFFHQLHIMVYHAPHQIFERYFPSPSKLFFGLLRIAPQHFNFRRTEKIRIHFHKRFAGCFLPSDFPDAASFPGIHIART